MLLEAVQKTWGHNIDSSDVDNFLVKDFWFQKIPLLVFKICEQITPHEQYKISALFMCVDWNLVIFRYIVPYWSAVVSSTNVLKMVQNINLNLSNFFHWAMKANFEENETPETLWSSTFFLINHTRNAAYSLMFLSQDNVYPFLVLYLIKCPDNAHLLKSSCFSPRNQQMLLFASSCARFTFAVGKGSWHHWAVTVLLGVFEVSQILLLFYKVCQTRLLGYKRFHYGYG